MHVCVTLSSPCYSYSPLITMPETPSPSHSPTPTLGPITSTPQQQQQQQQQQVAGFDWMVLVAAILCAFICALGLNTMLQCVFQCAARVLTQPRHWIASRRLNSGLKKKEMVALPTSTFSASSHSHSHSPNAPNCVICLTDFSDGDQIRFLPNCNHYFHVLCIDQWLLSHSSCPTCRHLLKSVHTLHIVLP